MRRTAERTTEPVSEPFDVPRPMAVLTEAMTASIVEFGVRTGLCAALAAGPATSAELAVATTGDERMAREWLHGMVAAQLVDQDGERYAWRSGAGQFFRGSAAFLDLAPGVALFGALARCVPAAAAAYHAGGRLGGDQYPDELSDAMRRMSAQWTTTVLPRVWLPGVPGMVDALRGSGRVAEIGCAGGATLEALATAFPAITAEGFDLDERAVNAGNARLEQRGLADRVVLRPIDAAAGLTGEYDLVLALSVLHDAADLPGLLTAAAKALRPSGCLLVVESPPVEGPLAAMLLATSLLYCVPTTAARGGTPWGTLGLPPDVLVSFAADAGLAALPALPSVHPMVAAYAFGRQGPSPEKPPAAPRTAVPRVGRGRLVGRALLLMAYLLVVVLHVGAGWLVDRARGRGRAQSRLTRRLVRHLERLGPTYVKFGQMLGSRADLFPAHVTEQLAALHDGVRRMTDAESRRQWDLAVGQQPRLGELRLTDRCLGSGSMACVYEATDVDGRAVAVKLQRPGVAASMSVDLALMTAFIRVAERLPRAGRAPLADLVGYMARALYGQVDFLQEASYTRRLAANLASHEHVVVPRVRDEYTSPLTLVTDLVPGLVNGVPAMDATLRTAVARRALDAVGSMIFLNDLVHCDLHPGNLHVRQDGSVVMLDAGYCVEVPETVRHALRDFFVNLALGNGNRCGEIMYDSGPPARHTAAGRSAFVHEIAELVAATTGRFDMIDFGPKVFDAQNRFGVRPPADFAFPLMSLMIVEGTLRRWWPDLEIPAATGL